MNNVKYVQLMVLFMLATFCRLSNAQNKTELSAAASQSGANGAVSSTGPKNITRTVIQDRRGNIWLASFGGVFRYDGKLFTNVTSNVSSARFFSVLEDSKGSLWFGSIGSGIYQYDGRSFRNFTTKDGLINNEVTAIYEDKTGDIWFGLNGGASRYDGQSFRNYILNGGSMTEDRTGKTVPDFTRPPEEVTSITEDKTGRLWVGTRSNTFVYDGKTFTNTTELGKAFNNVRSIIRDKAGNILLGGNDGLWRYDGITFTNFSTDFVGYIYEDKNGNIWTSAQKAASGQWVLSRYDVKSLSNSNPAVTEINPNEGKMLFGILQANDGAIWFGSDGVYRYDGKTVTDFKKAK